MSSILPAPVGPCTEFFGYPKGDATCTVTSFSPATISIPESMILHPSGGDHSNQHPIIISLIHHAPSNSYVLFDLGLSTNWRDYAPKDRLGKIEEVFKPVVTEDVDQVLKRLGVEKEQIKYIVVSHSHWDHCAHDFSRFSSAQVIVGPSTLENVSALSPDHYSTSNSSLKPIELSWEHSPTHILTFRHSYDVFSDGSFLVVPTPGHTPGHVAGVVRTRSSSNHDDEEYVVLAGDCAHHPLCLSVKPQQAGYRFSCWREAGEPENEVGKHSMHEDYEEAERSLERLKALEKRQEFLVVLAHDFERWNLWAKEKDEKTGAVKVDGWRKKGMKP